MIRSNIALCKFAGEMSRVAQNDMHNLTYFFIFLSGEEVKKYKITIFYLFVKHELYAKKVEKYTL